MPVQEDKYLYDRMKQGDSSAFDTLFRRHYPALCAYAGRFVRPSDAENIVQDVMLNLWEKRGETVIRNAFTTYLYTSVKNRCVNLINRGIVMEKVLNAVQLSMRDQFENPELYIHGELTGKLSEALAKLPETYRSAFEKNRFDNMSYKEIAQESGVSVKTIEYRISQAIRLLRVELKEYLPLLALLFLDKLSA